MHNLKEVCVSTCCMLRSRSASKFKSDGKVLPDESVKSYKIVDKVRLASRVSCRASYTQSLRSMISMHLPISYSVVAERKTMYAIASFETLVIGGTQRYFVVSDSREKMFWRANSDIV